MDLVPGLGRGGTPSQVWPEGGYPIPGLARGYPIPGLAGGVPHPRSGWGGTPSQVGGGTWGTPLTRSG